MKEQRFFYVPQPAVGQLPDEEAQHALRVLRLGMGDELFLMDGRGTFHRAIITEADNHRRCRYRIEESISQQPEWLGQIHLAVAPTKIMDRMEWLAEKATEVGVDRLSLLDCRFSERKVVKNERLEKIIVAAMKQSHKAWKPLLDEMMTFESFIHRNDLPEQRFIAHCYDEHDVPITQKPFLADVLKCQMPALVMVGPEGDFSIEEVRAAEAAGFRSVSLGTSRLRTETAALVAVHLMRLANR
ncbi:MAG: 16S rRNA (uracil(1498)-N(3))-methyltransferase [Bacteroidales bacterium]|nr:16S rRNA (uracil(1498)-N(3))-methyltransferase [Bacteroidales bacterium]